MYIEFLLMVVMSGPAKQNKYHMTHWRELSFKGAQYVLQTTCIFNLFMAYRQNNLLPPFIYDRQETKE